MMPLISFLVSWFAVGFFMGAIKEYKVKVAIIIMIICVFLLFLLVFINPVAFGEYWEPWWYYLVGLPILFFGDWVGKGTMQELKSKW